MQGMKKSENKKFMDILKRRKLSQKEFAHRTTELWREISGRTLSQNAVTDWAKGHAVPKLSPNEQAAVLSILDCTAFEWAAAFWPIEQQKKQEKQKKKE